MHQSAGRDGDEGVETQQQKLHEEGGRASFVGFGRGRDGASPDCEQEVKVESGKWI